MARIALFSCGNSDTSILSSGYLAVFCLCALLSGCSKDNQDFAKLFGIDNSQMTSPDMEEVLAAFSGRLTISTDGLRLEDENCGDVSAKTEIIDLNSDGTAEIVVHWGNACTSGSTGRSLSMFIKDDPGPYRDQFGFPAHSFEILGKTVDGYPDLQIGGQGFCFPVWSWNGNAYEFKCNNPQVEGGCEQKKDIC